jgi:hypothetical protein
MTGGLASPPESRINSPLFPQGSSASLTSGNLSLVQCINPRDLHPGRFFPDYNESDEEDIISPTRSRMPSVQPSSPPPAVSDCDFGADPIVAAEFLKSVLKVGENNDENAAMASVRSRESSLHPQDDDATTMVVDQSRAASLEPQDDDVTMVGIPSRTPSPEPRDNEEGVTMVGFESNDRLGSPSASSEPQEDDATMIDVPSREPSPEPQDNEESLESKDRLGSPSASSEPQEDDANMVGVLSRKPSPEPQDNEEGLESNDRLGSPSASSEPQEDDDTMVGVPSRKPSPEPLDNEEEEPMSDSKVPLSNLSDPEEDDEEYQPTNAVESSDSSDNKKSAGPIVGTEEATPKAVTDLNQMLKDFEYSVNLQGEIPLRRSSRNILSKEKPTINYADYPAPRKSSSGRKKLSLENEYHQLASL